MVISGSRSSIAGFGVAALALLAGLLLIVARQGTAAPQLPALTPAVSASPSSSTLGPGLAALAQHHPGRQVEVIIQLRAGGDPSALGKAISVSGGNVVQELPLINGLAAQVPAREAVALAAMQTVRAVSLNSKVQSTSLSGATGLDSNLATSYDQAIQATQAWSMGATGAGVGVAVIDTGVDGNLPDFQVSPTNSASRVIASAVVNPLAPNASDTYGHGTHVAGIIAGDGWNLGSSNADDGKYVGVAPQANLISVKADDGNGNTSVLDLIDGIEFVVAHQAQFNIRVINLSVRSDTAQSYTTDPLDAAVEDAWLHGIVVVAAAGNLGNASDAVDYSPGNDPYVITVGAVDDEGTPGDGDDTIPSWSSSGITQDGFAKPDVLAPGAHIVSTLAPNSDFASLCPSCITDGSYFKAGGTSMAAAVVSGAVADILSLHPSWTPDQVKADLIDYGRPVPKSGGSADEVNLNAALHHGGGNPPAPADQGLTPNQYVNPATGNIIDQTGSWATGSWGTGSWGTGSWSSGVWNAASGSWVAPWAQDSYTGAPLSPAGFTAVPPDCVQLQRANFTTGSWATAGWTANELSTDLNACITASTQAGSWGTGSWGTGSWGTGSWGTGSWGTGSWGTGSWSTGSWSTGSWSTDFDD